MKKVTKKQHDAAMKKFEDGQRVLEIETAQHEQDNIIERATTDTFIVRCYDKFDGYWFDVTKAISLKEAKKVYNKSTKNGTWHICYEDGTYYRIFPADTQMIFK